MSKEDIRQRTQELFDRGYRALGRAVDPRLRDLGVEAEIVALTREFSPHHSETIRLLGNESGNYHALEAVTASRESVSSIIVFPGSPTVIEQLTGLTGHEPREGHKALDIAEGIIHSFE